MIALHGALQLERKLQYHVVLVGSCCCKLACCAVIFFLTENEAKLDCLTLMKYQCLLLS